ncbi:MAG: LEA type 2 family protein [Chitinophagales bacterium]|nr:LEA type 2 family protein [Chitinophagales bacterium]
MKHSLFALAIVLLLLPSCKVLPPVYRSIENPKFERAGTTGFRFAADVKFYNPNGIRCRVQDIAMDVLLDEKQVGTIGQKTDVLVKRKSDFVIPVGVSINPSAGLLNNLTALFDILRDKEIALTLKGNVKVKALGLTFPIPVQYQQKVKLSQLQLK